MSDENDKRTPLEKALNLPSIDEINENFNNEAIEATEAPDDPYIDDLDTLDDYDLEDVTEQDAEALKKEIAETQNKIAMLKEQKRHEQHLKSYHTDVDSIHTKAMEKFDEIMSVALTMEANAGSKYLASATKLLDIALSAKNSGMDREIEMAKLQLRKEKQDHDMNRKHPKDISGYDGADESSGDGVEGQGETFYRNSLVQNFSEDR